MNFDILDTLPTSAIPTTYLQDEVQTKKLARNGKEKADMFVNHVKNVFKPFPHPCNFSS